MADQEMVFPVTDPSTEPKTEEEAVPPFGAPLGTEFMQQLAQIFAVQSQQMQAQLNAHLAESRKRDERREETMAKRESKMMAEVSRIQGQVRQLEQQVQQLGALSVAAGQRAEVAGQTAVQAGQMAEASVSATVAAQAQAQDAYNLAQQAGQVAVEAQAKVHQVAASVTTATVTSSQMPSPPPPQAVPYQAQTTMQAPHVEVRLPAQQVVQQYVPMFANPPSFSGPTMSSRKSASAFVGWFEAARDLYAARGTEVDEGQMIHAAASAFGGGVSGDALVLGPMQRLPGDATTSLQWELEVLQGGVPAAHAAAAGGEAAADPAAADAHGAERGRTGPVHRQGSVAGDALAQVGSPTRPTRCGNLLRRGTARAAQAVLCQKQHP